MGKIRTRPDEGDLGWESFSAPRPLPNFNVEGGGDHVLFGLGLTSCPATLILGAGAVGARIGRCVLLAATARETVKLRQVLPN